MNGKLKVLVAAGLSAVLIGCGTVDGAVKSNVANAHKLAKNSGGYVIGLVSGLYTVDNPVGDLERACSIIKNQDARCTEHNVGVVYAQTGFGFSAAAAGVIVAIPSTFKVKPCGSPGGKGCTYAKVKAEPGKFGTILEVYMEGENGCHWSGMPRAGGVVCNDWDYRKDMRDWDTTNGVMTVKDN